MAGPPTPHILIRHTLLFMLFNTLLYFFIGTFHTFIPLNRFSYHNDAHHYFTDPRITGKGFNLLHGMAQFDAQWYLKIIDSGYSFSPTEQSLNDKSLMQNPSYAFFPAFPLLGWLTKVIFKDSLLAAFILTQILLVCNFLSLMIVISRLYNPQIAIRASWLLFVFPFSIFFRSYYAESLLMLFLVWFSYFLLQKKFLPASILLGLINVTKGTVVLVNFIFLFILIKSIVETKIKPLTAVVYPTIIGLPMLVWMVFNYLTAHNPIYFFAIQSVWYSPMVLPAPILNLILLMKTIDLPFHTVHASQLDNLVAFFVIILLYLSRKTLPLVLWGVSLSIFLTPLLVRDLAAFTRFQSVSFPLFIFLATKTSSLRTFLPLFILSALGLCLVSLFFVNWYWIG